MERDRGYLSWGVNVGSEGTLGRWLMGMHGGMQGIQYSGGWVSHSRKGVRGYKESNAKREELNISRAICPEGGKARITVKEIVFRTIEEDIDGEPDRGDKGDRVGEEGDRGLYVKHKEWVCEIVLKECEKAVYGNI